MSQRLSIPEAAAQLGLTEAALRQRVARCKVPAERVEGRLYVLLPDVPPNTTSHDTSHQASQPPSQPLHHQDGALVVELRGRVATLEREAGGLWEQLSVKDRQIGELHVLLQQAQARPALAAVVETFPAPEQPAPRRAPWWRRLVGQAE